jgi:uncharacterized C2H2 Zn-finger protein
MAKTDKERLKAGKRWVNCWICEVVFRRRRQTMRYCNKCGRGFCEGEHGNFSRGVGICVIDGVRKKDQVVDS